MIFSVLVLAFQYLAFLFFAKKILFTSFISVNWTNTKNEGNLIELNSFAFDPIFINLT